MKVREHEKEVEFREFVESPLTSVELISISVPFKLMYIDYYHVGCTQTNGKESPASVLY